MALKVPAPLLVSATEPVGGTGADVSVSVTVTVQVDWTSTGVDDGSQFRTKEVTSGDRIGFIDIMPLTRV